MGTVTDRNERGWPTAVSTRPADLAAREHQRTYDAQGLPLTLAGHPGADVCRICAHRFVQCQKARCRQVDDGRASHGKLLVVIRTLACPIGKMNHLEPTP